MVSSTDVSTMVAKKLGIMKVRETNAKKRAFEHYLVSSEDQSLFIKKEDMSSKRRTYGYPTE